MYKDKPKARGSEDGRGRIKVWERLMNYVLGGASVGSLSKLEAWVESTTVDLEGWSTSQQH